MTGKSPKIVPLSVYNGKISQLTKCDVASRSKIFSSDLSGNVVIADDNLAKPRHGPYTVITSKSKKVSDFPKKSQKHGQTIRNQVCSAGERTTLTEVKLGAATATQAEPSSYVNKDLICPFCGLMLNTIKQYNLHKASHRKNDKKDTFHIDSIKRCNKSLNESGLKRCEQHQRNILNSLKTHKLLGNSNGIKSEKDSKQLTIENGVYDLAEETQQSEQSSHHFSDNNILFQVLAENNISAKDMCSGDFLGSKDHFCKIKPHCLNQKTTENRNDGTTSFRCTCDKSQCIATCAGYDKSPNCKQQSISETIFSNKQAVCVHENESIQSKHKSTLFGSSYTPQLSQLFKLCVAAYQLQSVKKLTPEYSNELEKESLDDSGNPDTTVVDTSEDDAYVNTCPTEILSECFKVSGDSQIPLSQLRGNSHPNQLPNVVELVNCSRKVQYSIETLTKENELKGSNCDSITAQKRQHSCSESYGHDGECFVVSHHLYQQEQPMDLRVTSKIKKETTQSSMQIIESSQNANNCQHDVSLQNNKRQHETGYLAKNYSSQQACGDKYKCDSLSLSSQGLKVSSVGTCTSKPQGQPSLRLVDYSDTESEESDSDCDTETRLKCTGHELKDVMEVENRNSIPYPVCNIETKQDSTCSLPAPPKIKRQICTNNDSSKPSKKFHSEDAESPVKKDSFQVDIASTETLFPCKSQNLLHKMHRNLDLEIKMAKQTDQTHTGTNQNHPYCSLVNDCSVESKKHLREETDSDKEMLQQTKHIKLEHVEQVSFKKVSDALESNESHLSLKSVEKQNIDRESEIKISELNLNTNSLTCTCGSAFKQKCVHANLCIDDSFQEDTLGEDCEMKTSEDNVSRNSDLNGSNSKSNAFVHVYSAKTYSSTESTEINWNLPSICDDSSPVTTKHQLISTTPNIGDHCSRTSYLDLHSCREIKPKNGSPSKKTEKVSLNNQCGIGISTSVLVPESPLKGLGGKSQEKEVENEENMSKGSNSFIECDDVTPCDRFSSTSDRIRNGGKTQNARSQSDAKLVSKELFPKVRKCKRRQNASRKACALTQGRQLRSHSRKRKSTKDHETLVQTDSNANVLDSDEGVRESDVHVENISGVVAESTEKNPGENACLKELKVTGTCTLMANDKKDLKQEASTVHGSHLVQTDKNIDMHVQNKMHSGENINMQVSLNQAEDVNKNDFDEETLVDSRPSNLDTSSVFSLGVPIHNILTNSLLSGFSFSNITQMVDEIQPDKFLDEIMSMSEDSLDSFLSGEEVDNPSVGPHTDMATSPPGQNGHMTTNSKPFVRSQSVDHADDASVAGSYHELSMDCGYSDCGTLTPIGTPIQAPMDPSGKPRTPGSAYGVSSAYPPIPKKKWARHFSQQLEVNSDAAFKGENLEGLSQQQLSHAALDLDGINEDSNHSTSSTGRGTKSKRQKKAAKYSSQLLDDVEKIINKEENIEKVRVFIGKKTQTPVFGVSGLKGFTLVSPCGKSLDSSMMSKTAVANNNNPPGGEGDSRHSEGSVPQNRHRYPTSFRNVLKAMRKREAKMRSLSEVVEGKEYAKIGTDLSARRNERGDNCVDSTIHLQGEDNFFNDTCNYNGIECVSKEGESSCGDCDSESDDPDVDLDSSCSRSSLYLHRQCARTIDLSLLIKKQKS